MKSGLRFLVLLLAFIPFAGMAQYQGGDNDGNTMALSCGIMLDGTSTLSISAITGVTAYCPESTEVFSVVVTGGTQKNVIVWSVPAGSTIVSGQGTSSILVSFGSTDGDIRVDVTNECASAFVTHAVTATTCTMYGGGENDGSTANLNCATNLDGGSVFIPEPIAGSDTFCESATETYSIVVGGALPTTIYSWSVPAGATIVSGQGTNTILVTFGTTDGDIVVDISNECETIQVTKAVTATSCIFYAGGENDGAAAVQNCATNLNGGSVFIPDPIAGSSTFCTFATEVYSINVAGALPTTVYSWSVPAGATIVSGQGTNSILVTFGADDGDIVVDISNECETIQVTKAVAATSCIFYAGGENDGAASSQGCATNLNGGSTFITGPIVGSATFCTFATEVYTIDVAGALPNTVFVWSVPAGATIVSGQGTSTILVTFGASDGDISVDVSNECETINVSTPVTITSCVFYAGGENDGSASSQGCATNLDGGSTFIPGPIVGSTTFCTFATETYTITVAGSLPSTVYSWSVPAGATIVNGQGTNTILVQFGAFDGDIEVAVSNECETINVTLPVMATSCVFYAGGSNDGFAMEESCISALGGTSAFIPGPIIGSTTFCDFGREGYSITVGGANSSTVYNWSVPPGASIVSGQGTNSILVQFGTTGGNISVDVSNACELITVSAAVSSTSCIFYTGGSNDGFAVTTVINIPLPVQLVSFEASVKGGQVHLRWTTASELNNDYFTVERSRNGVSFEELATVAGAGTTNEANQYSYIDTHPLAGISYYRLRQTDFDGTVTVHRLVYVRVDDIPSGITALYPNPVKNGSELHLDYYATSDGTVTVYLRDGTGRLIGSETIPVHAGENFLLFRPRIQSAGAYLLTVDGDGKRLNFRVVVE